MNQSPDSVLQKVLWGVKRGAFSSEVGQALARAVYLGVEDDIVRQLVEGELRSLRQLEATGQLPPFLSAHLNRGEILFGSDIYGQPIRIPLRAFCAGTLVVANTGGGKTTVFKSVLPQIAAHEVAVWVTESHKKELRGLRHLI